MKRVLLFLLILLTTTSQCSAYTTYTNLSFYNVSASDVIALGSEYNGSELVSIKATIIDDSTKVNPYDHSQDGLVGEWRFDEGTGTLVQDLSTNSNNGTAIGGMNWTQGKYNTSGLFTGDNDYVDLGAEYNLSSESWSILFWFNKTTNTLENFISTDSAGNTKYVNSGDERLIRVYNGSEYITGNTKYELNILNQAGIVYNDTDSKIYFYLNGVSDGSSHVGYDSDQNNLLIRYIGADHGSTRRYLTGEMDQVLMYNRVLTDSEIKNNYIEKLEQVQLNTTANTTLSTYWNSSSDNPNSLYFDAFELFSSIIPTVPSSILSNATTVYDYQNSTQFDINISLGIDNADVLNLTIINETQSLLYFNVTYTDGYPTFNIAWDGKANNGTANTSTLYYQNGTSITSNSTYVANSVLLVPPYLLPSDTTYYIAESTTWAVAAGSIFQDIIHTIFYNGTITYSPQPTQSSINLSAVFEPRMEVL